MAKKGQRLGRWVLSSVIGGGGNGDVWDGVRDDGIVDAVKVLRRTNPNSEAYRRFRDEIAVLRGIVDVAGVVPLLDANLPSTPSETDPAWLAMPKREPLRASLGQAPALGLVVEAISSIGITLAELVTRGVFHRDIKPANLYGGKDEWAVGDFGLVSFPDKEAITADDRRFGPVYFVAPEMLADPTTAQPGPADVYSLAKTFWVLVTGREWPLGGEHHVGASEFALATYCDDSRAGLLDAVLFAATRNDPVLRLTMTELVQEFDRWSTPLTVETEPLDLSELEQRMAAHRAPAVAARDAQNARTRLTGNAIGHLRSAALIDINERLERLVPESGSQAQMPVLMGEGSLVGLRDATWWAVHRVADGSESKGFGPIQLYAALGAGLRDDGHLVLGAGYLIIENHARETVWYDERIFIAETANEEAAVAELANGLYAHLAVAVQGVVRRLDERHGASVTDPPA